jgi:hypothetical protein
MNSIDKRQSIRHCIISVENETLIVAYFESVSSLDLLEKS